MGAEQEQLTAEPLESLPADGLGVTAEQARDLAALAQSVADSEPLAPGQLSDTAQDARQEAATFSQVNELAGVILTIGQLAGMRFKSLKDIYTKERCTETAEALNPVFEELGWNVTGGSAGKYITAGAAVLFLGMETREAIRGDLEAEAKAANEPQE